MRVRLVRSGGIAGLRRAGELDTAALAPAEAAEVEDLVGRLLAAAGAAAGGRPGADRFWYELTVGDDTAGERHVSVSEADLGPEARGLLARLEDRLGRAGG